jgi:subtilase family serine protease
MPEGFAEVSTVSADVVAPPADWPDPQISPLGELGETMIHFRPRAVAAVGALALATLGVATSGAVSSGSPSAPGAAATAVPTGHLGLHPAVTDYTQMSTSTTPPTESQCYSAGRRCFTPVSTRAAYDVQSLIDRKLDGRGMTIAIVDSHGSDTIAHDLHVYNQAFGLPAMCGEEGVACANGMPTFSELHLQGSPATKAPPSQSQSPGLQDKSAWALEVSLDVETAHSIAPGANLLLVTTPVSETLGVQGFPQMMAAEKYVVDHHLATVISQSFGSAEEAFGSAKSLLNLRDAFVAAAQNGVTVLASSGDDGSFGTMKQPVGGPNAGPVIPFPVVDWPASDPLVTGVGGTYLCTNAEATAGRVVDSINPPGSCRAHPGAAEVGWTFSGGGFSHVFDKPDYQATLPDHSTAIGANRGVPDISLQASAGTGALIYITLPPDGQSGLICGSAPCSTGWYDVGGTSLASPEWAGLVAIADQINGGGLGLINPGLYRIGADAGRYAADFHDVTLGNNTADPSVPGYPATLGWDPVTGLGTPDAAVLLPDLVAAVHGH